MKHHALFSTFLLLTAAAWAQTSTGGVSGTVTDPGGAVVPGVKLTITNLNTNEARRLDSNESGAYSFTALPPGRYRFEAELNGFKRFVIDPVEVRVQQFVTLDPRIEVGQSTQTVEVTGQVALLDAQTSSLSQVVENRQVTELPLNGRNTLALVALTPGVRTQGEFMQHTATRSFAGWGNFSSNGGVSDANEILVDGASVTMFLVNAPSLIPPVDATQEFRVQTNNYSAEFGRSSGAVVNIGIKSGSNALHGSAYEFLRNNKLDANDFFQNRAGQPRPKRTFNQYGFSIGGPIAIPKAYNGRNRTFFFFNFEGFRQRLARALTTSVPTAAQLSGDFSQTYNSAGQQVIVADPLAVSNGLRAPFPGNRIPSNRFDSVADRLRQPGRIWAPANTPGAPFTGINNFSTSSTQPSDEDQAVTRIDHTFSAKWRIFGTYAAQSFALGGWDPFRNGTDLLTVGGNESNLTQTAVVGATLLLSSNLVAELRSSYSRFRNNRIPGSDGFDLGSLGFPQSITNLQQFHSFPRLTFSGVQSLGKLSTSEIRRISNNWNESGSLTWIRGPHTLKAGAQYRVQQLNDIQLDNSSGDFTFTERFTSTDPLRGTASSGNTIASMLLGYPSSGALGIGERLALQRKYVAMFAQDDWKATRKLTLNLGFRYDIELGPTERYLRQTYLDLASVAPITQKAGLSSPGALRFTDKDVTTPKATYFGQMGPRFGFAYQLRERTVLRGGYGIFWLPGGNETSGTSTRNPAATVSTPFVSSLDNGITPYDRLSNPFPNGLIPLFGHGSGLNTLIGQSVTSYIRGAHDGYTGQWNFDIQHQLAREFAIDIAYAGSKGTGLPVTIQANQLEDRYLSLGPALNQQVVNPFYGLVNIGALASSTVSRGQLLRPYPQFTGFGLGMVNAGSNTYHSMQLKVNKRFSSSLIVLAYTLSKGIGDSEAVVGWLEPSGTPSSFQNNNNRRLDRSVNAFDSPQRLVLAFTTELPFGKGKRWGMKTGVLSHAISGWDVNGIYTAESGQPLFLTTSSNLTNSLGGGSRPNNSGKSANLTTDEHGRLDRWFDTSVFSQPAAFTFGNTARTLPDVRNHGTNNLDLGVAKNNRFLKDGRMNLQFRGEFFNVFNRVRFGNPGMTYSTAQFGVINDQANSPRLLQFALKLIF